MHATQLRTLVISPNWIGDAVMAQPLLRSLREQHQHQPIDVLAPAWVAPVWRSMREVDMVLETPFRHGALQLRERWAFARNLRQRGYADAYVLPNTLKFALIPWLAGIPRRVGYLGEMRYGLLNVIHRDNSRAPKPMVAFYEALAHPPASVGTLVPPRPELSVPGDQSDRALSEAGLEPGLRLVVFAPGAEFGSAKQWPAAHFAQLAQTLRQMQPDMQIALLGSAKDKSACEEVAALAPQVRSLAGATSLGDAIAIIARAEAVVSNDSGLLHIASALNRPVIAIYGPTDPGHAPPFSDMAASLSLKLDCSPCMQRECPLGHHRCMRELGAERVWQALQPMLPMR